MPIPTQSDMFSVVLEVMQDGEVKSIKEVKNAVRDKLGLTPEECGYKTGSGVPVYESRAGWSISYLNRAGLVTRVAKGVYQVSDAGRRLHATGKMGSELYHELNRIIAATNPWNVGSEGGEQRGVQDADTAGSGVWAVRAGSICSKCPWSGGACIESQIRR